MAARGAGGYATKSSSAVGMMEGAYFVPRTELIAWVNSLLQISITKVEQCASGAIYCQILDACSPGSVAMRKVNWIAKSDHEFIPNYKVLQAGFEKNAIEKHIEVDKLIRAKYQDNLEFLQWIKCHWERSSSSSSVYDPVKARDGRPLPLWARAAGPAATLSGSNVEKENQRPPPSAANKRVVAVAGGLAKPTAKTLAPQTLAPQTNRSPRCGTMLRSASAKDTSCKGLATASEDSFQRERALQRECDELRVKTEQQGKEMTDLRGSLDGLEQERDYYFQKLREVEIFVETMKASMDPDVSAGKMLDDVQRILYESTDEPEEAAAGGGELSTSW